MFGGAKNKEMQMKLGEKNSEMLSKIENSSFVVFAT